MPNQTPIERAAQAIRDVYDDPADLSGMPPTPLDRAAALAALMSIDVKALARVVCPSNPDDSPASCAYHIGRAEAVKAWLLGGAS